ncbi:hypothetical protein K2173_014997 [Erythroxylum novogranatense]|uniref:Protein DETOXIFICATION n=1 Tax=Erythroxylum novogranatense TaxID=1862640 RepID=A0AAV8TUD5_9ROSI|nr:hypothetical protein K2173_014997 [Erythroxylum novogranatense]
MEEVEGTERKWEVSWGVFVEELRKTSCLAAPMVGVSVLQYLLPITSMVIVGHLNPLALSSVAIATSLTNITGFSFMSGMAGGLETLCGQAYGAGEYQKLGTFTYSAIISLLIICPPICLLWILMDRILILTGQDPLIAYQARKYSVWLIPALFGTAVLKPLTRFLQTQSLTLPMLLSTISILFFHVTACWTLVYEIKLGETGAALAFGLSTWLNVALLGLYVKYSSTCAKTRAPFSRQAFRSVGKFYRFGVPSAMMICLKWWSMEVLTVVSGILPNPELETSVFSIGLTISTLHFTIPYGFGAAASTRVSNELGAGNPQFARMVVVVAVCLAGTEAAIASTILFFCRQFVGYAYSNDKHVVEFLATITPILCISLFMDSFQAILSGIARGCGWQGIGAYINLFAFYLVGLPVAVVLGFVAHLRVKGLWLGIVAGSLVQSSLLSLVTLSIDWEKQVIKASKRILDRSTEEDEEGE